jgi:hypothetical protein
MAKEIIHAIIQSVNGSNHVKTLHATPANTDDLLSLVVAINHKHQLTVWFPKELPVETAQSIADNFANDMKKDLGDS